jgi:8-oxo-dGTP pyrophosphatase MutT (NUDIX family)
VEVQIGQRELREKTGLSHDVIKRNLKILVEYEFLKASGFSGRGSKKLYSLVEDAPLNLVDTSVIPSPEEMEAETPKAPKWGKPGSVSGSDPLGLSHYRL